MGRTSSRSILFVCRSICRCMHVRVCVGVYVHVHVHVRVHVCESPHIFVSEWHAYYLGAYARVHRSCMSVCLLVHDFVYIHVRLYQRLCSYVCAYAFTSFECITKLMRTDPCICLYVYVLLYVAFV